MTNRPILLVEDNIDDEMLALRAFKKLNIGNEIIVARDGVQALEYLFATDQSEEADSEGVSTQVAGTGNGGAPAASTASLRELDPLPAVILLDLKLPKIDGLEVLRRIRSHDRTRLLPVVILTSSKEEKDKVQGYNLGANSYVRKPIDYNEFVHAVSQLGVYWLLLNQLPNMD